MGSVAVNVRLSGTRLKGLHRALMSGRWQSRDWSLLDRAGLEPRVLDQLRASWQDRLVAEYRSAAMATQFANLLLLVGAPLDLVGVMSRITQDEIRHSAICAEVLEALGSDPIVETDADSLAIPVHDDPPLPVQVLDLTIYLFCLCETVSFHLLDTVARQTECPPLKSANRQIARDERLHKEYGWLATRALLEDMGDPARSFLQERLPDYFPVLESAFANPAALEGAALVSADQQGLGCIQVVDQHAAFYRAMDHDILPRFERLGFPAREIWQRTRRVPATAVSHA